MMVAVDARDGQPLWTQAVPGAQERTLAPLVTDVGLWVGTRAGLVALNPVSGAWRWQQGYFCRDLYFGSDDLGFNCQMVTVNGSTIRFIADQGQGEHADFRLR